MRLYSVSEISRLKAAQVKHIFLDKLDVSSSRELK